MPTQISMQIMNSIEYKLTAFFSSAFFAAAAFFSPAFLAAASFSASFFAFSVRTSSRAGFVVSFAFLAGWFSVMVRPTLAFFASGAPSTSDSAFRFVPLVLVAGFSRAAVFFGAALDAAGVIVAALAGAGALLGAALVVEDFVVIATEAAFFAEGFGADFFGAAFVTFAAAGLVALDLAAMVELGFDFVFLDWGCCSSTSSSGDFLFEPATGFASGTFALEAADAALFGAVFVATLAGALVFDAAAFAAAVTFFGGIFGIERYCVRFQERNAGKDESLNALKSNNDQRPMPNLQKKFVKEVLIENNEIVDGRSSGVNAN